MAVVYLAEDVRHRRRVAVKVLRQEPLGIVGGDRFLREIEIASKLTHPYVLPLLDSGAAGDLLFYVMPYVEGDSLRDRLMREKQLPLEDALQIARDVAEALAYAHQQGVIHRDIKPENILLSGGHALVADFGIARALGAAGASPLTSTGVVLGTPAYMSPEQAVGGEADARSDVYALGCVLYEALAGSPPFTGSTVQVIQARHQFDPMPSLRSVRPAVPEGVERAIGRALAKTPADRFASAREFADAIAAASATGPTPLPSAPTTSAALAPGATPRTTTAETPTAPIGRMFTGRRIPLWTGVAGVLAVIGAVTFLVLRSADLAPAAPSGPRDWILVADFDGPSTDPDLAAAARELICAAL